MRGRPKKGTTAPGSSARNVRMQDAEWDALTYWARKRGLTVHAAMREALVHWIARTANAEAKKAGSARPTARTASARRLRETAKRVAE